MRGAAGTSSASMYAMSAGAARRRERRPAAECADSRSSRSSSVDLNARTTRSCKQHDGDALPRRAAPHRRTAPAIPRVWRGCLVSGRGATTACNDATPARSATEMTSGTGAATVPDSGCKQTIKLVECPASQPRTAAARPSGHRSCDCD